MALRVNVSLILPHPHFDRLSLGGFKAIYMIYILCRQFSFSTSHHRIRENIELPHLFFQPNQNHPRALLVTMQFFHYLLGFLSFLGVSSACLKLDGTQSQNKDYFYGTLNDNGIEVCKWRYGKLTSPSFFATCLPGFAAYITQNAEIVGYSNHGNELAFRTTIVAIPPAYPGLPIEFHVTAANYGC